MSVETRPTHTITLTDVTAWLAEHGLDINEVLEAVIRVDRDAPNEHVGAWLDVKFFLLTARGERHADFGKDPAEIATGHATIPLASFPRLTPVPPREDEP